VLRSAADARSLSFSAPAPQGAERTLRVPLPDDCRNANLYVEARADSVTRGRPLYANSLNVHVVENYGRLTVSGAAVSSSRMD
jgi:hypothetical protein